MTPAPGCRIGDYEVLRLLGKGGMGEVYLSRDTRLGREAALKILPSELQDDDRRKRRFLREAKLASRLVHPNAAVIYEVGEWAGGVFLAMEYVAGQALNHRLNGGSLSLPELMGISEQLTSVLGAAHGQGIIHRDLKPGNIMITPNGQAKLLDFGLARLDNRVVTEHDNTVTVETAPGDIYGTVAYLSPEQLRGGQAGARSDLFALGVVFYEMATGRRPFDGENSTALIANILQQTPEPILRWNYAIPAEYERIVRKCLEKDPANRYQSATDIGIDLRNLQRDSQTHAPVTAAATSGRPSRRGWIAGGVAGMAALAAAGVWVWPRIRSLAVLPLSPTGSPDPAYLAEGVTEALINEFSRVRQLRVLARSTVYNRSVPAQDPMAAARKLGVDAVITGHVDQSADRLKIALELISGSDGRQVWGKTTEVNPAGLPTVAVELAQAALEALGLGGKTTGSKAAIPADGETFQNYLRGRYQMNKRTRDGIEKALTYFKEAQDRDPAFAPPYAGMATALVLKSGFTPPKDVFPMAQAAAQRALELDPTLPEAHGMLGVIRLIYQWDWRGSETEMTRALDLNPNYAFGHANYSQYLICRKRFEEALTQVKRAAELDPLSSAHAFTLGLVYYQARQFDRSIAQLGKAIENEPKSPVGYFYRGTAYLAAQQYEKAIGDFDTGLKLTPDNGAIADQGLAYARTGRADKAREAIARIQESGKQRYVSPHLLAFPYIGLGETDRALECLEQAAEERSGWVVYMGVEPKLDPLRSHPRFRKLEKLVGV